MLLVPKFLEVSGRWESGQVTHTPWESFFILRARAAQTHWDGSEQGALVLPAAKQPMCEIWDPCGLSIPKYMLIG